MDGFALFARAFALGVAVAAPVGAMSVLLIQRTATGGWHRGLATGLGIATADATYAAAAGLGLAALAPVVARWAPALQVVGGIALVVLGIRALLAGPPDPQAAARGSLRGAYASAVALTLANPTTIAAFAAALTAIGVLAGGGLRSAALAAVGVGSGSLAWWLGLTTFVSLGAGRLDGKALALLSRVAAVALAVFGGVMIARTLV